MPCQQLAASVGEPLIISNVARRIAMSEGTKRKSDTKLRTTKAQLGHRGQGIARIMVVVMMMAMAMVQFRSRTIIRSAMTSSDSFSTVGRVNQSISQSPFPSLSPANFPMPSPSPSSSATDGVQHLVVLIL
jgi:hypothetical protein